MKRSGGATWRPVRVFLILIVSGSMLVGPYVGSTSGHIGESAFASVVQPIGVAATPGRLLVTRPFCGNPRQVLSIDTSGAVSLFATLPDRLPGLDGSVCFEEYIAVAGPADPTQAGFPSPTKGGFKSNFAYVTQGSNIIEISPTGVVSPSPFATISSCGSTASHNGITFDHVGSFGFNMIVTCGVGHTGRAGTVWKVTSNGTVTLIADVTAALELEFVLIENPDVAPMSFSPYGGHIFVAAEGPGQVFAVSPTGGVSAVASWPSAEGVNFIPSSKCTFGTSGGSFFTAILGAGNLIFQFPLSAFTGLSGRALVMSEFGAGIGLLTSTGASTITPTLFHANIGQHEGSTFVDCTVPLLLQIIVKPGSIPHTINPGSGGTVPVAILSSPSFNALTDTIVNTIKFGFTGTEDSLAFCNRSGQDVNGDGRLDLICHFETQKLGLPGPGLYRGPLILKMKYTAPGGDPDGEGLD